MADKINKYIKIGSKLSEQNKSKSKEEKEEIRAALCASDAFTEYCETETWSTEDHDNLLNILETRKNTKGYYVDIHGKGISYNGIRTLKRSKTEMDLSQMHLNEIEKCRKDYKYFRSYYCFITTKNGLARPEPRPYQEELEDALLELLDSVVLYPRQSGKTISVSTYLLWLALFHPTAINIGIVANRPKTAREVLDKLKKIFLELPIWMKKGIEIWNKSEIEFENGTRIMTDSPSSDSFRGYTVNIVFVDETAYISKSIWEEFVDSVMPTMNSLSFKQVILTSTANGMNHFEQIVRQAKLEDTPEQFVSCSWRDVPHYDKNNNIIPPDEYKKQVIKKYGLKFFNQTEACVGGSTIINTLEYGNITIEELYEKDIYEM